MKRITNKIRNKDVITIHQIIQYLRHYQRLEENIFART